MDERAVVTGFLRNGGDVLLLRRSDEVGSYGRKWGAVAGYAEGDPAGAIREEIREETGIDPQRCELVRSGDSFSVEDANLDRRWIVHPFLFDCPTRSVRLDWEHTDFEWTSPTELLTRETVPNLWNSYDAVRPTVETVRTDTEHGSAYLSIRALEVLRDEAGLLVAGRASAFEGIEAVATALLEARPAMTVVANRIHRTMDAADGSPEAVERSARKAVERATEVERKTAENLVEWLDSRPTGTLSRSGTVRRAVREGRPTELLIPESRPGREGVSVAAELASAVPVTLTTDAAFPDQLTKLEDPVLVLGADSILPDGSVINKVGTRPAATTAKSAGIPVVVGAATDKVRPDHETDFEPRPSSELYDGFASISVANPTFELTPPTAIDVIVTESGEFEPDELEAIASAHRTYRNWQ